MKLLGLHTHVVYLIIIIFFQLNWTIKHVSIVVSPLKSLMADQVADLQNFNVSAIAIEPGTSPETIRGKQIISIFTYSPIDDKWQFSYLFSCTFSRYKVWEVFHHFHVPRISDLPPLEKYTIFWRPETQNMRVCVRRGPLHFRMVCVFYIHSMY